MSKIKSLERQVAAQLVASLSGHPESWKYRDSDLDTVCGPNGIRMSANYFTIYAPEPYRFGFWNKRRIRRAFKQWRKAHGDDMADETKRHALLFLRDCLAEPLKAVA